MRTAKFSIVVLTESNFTKQSTLSTGSWMESRKNLIEHTHFKKKKFLKIAKKINFTRVMSITEVLVWQLPRLCAEPWRFVIVFERRMDAQMAVTYLSGGDKVQCFRSSPITLIIYKTIYACAHVSLGSDAGFTFLGSLPLNVSASTLILSGKVQISNLSGLKHFKFSFLSISQ